MRKSIAVVLVDRANLGRLAPVISEIRRQDLLDLQLVCGGTTVLESHGNVAGSLESQGYHVTRVSHEIAGSTHVAMAQSVGVGVLGYTQAFQSLASDLVLVIGDRFEMLSAAIAASMLGVCLVHVQGGEVSGSIDERIRHAVSKLADFHVPSTVRAAAYLTRMGESGEAILTVGCPSSDISRAIKPELKSRTDEIIVCFHPNTTEKNSGDQMRAVLQGVAAAKGERPVTVWRPNIDPGSNAIRDALKGSGMQLVTNLSPELFLERIARAACLVGNSSSFVRDASFFGTPVVLVGSRQDGREWDEHVKRVEPNADAISGMIRWQLSHGPYPASELYGDGEVSKRIADALVTVQARDKKLSYVSEMGVTRQAPKGGSRKKKKVVA